MSAVALISGREAIRRRMDAYEDAQYGDCESWDEQYAWWEEGEPYRHDEDGEAR